MIRPPPARPAAVAAPLGPADRRTAQRSDRPAKPPLVAVGARELPRTRPGATPGGPPALAAAGSRREPRLLAGPGDRTPPPRSLAPVADRHGRVPPPPAPG